MTRGAPASAPREWTKAEKIEALQRELVGLGMHGAMRAIEIKAALGRLGAEPRRYTDPWPTEWPFNADGSPRK